MLWLDEAEHRERLASTIEELRPRLLLLDPLVRLHRQDENDVRSVSALLGHLRELNRTFDLAVALVHHTSKRERAHPGQALRGSGDIYAWLDAGLYLAKKKSGIVLTVEHRSAPAPDPMSVALVTGSDGTARLSVADADAENRERGAADLAGAALDEISKAGAPITRSELRSRLGVRNQRLGRILATLERNRRIERSNGGWSVRRRANKHDDPTPELPFD